MNPFAAFDISDDEEPKFATSAGTGAEQRPPKKCNSFLIQPINREDRPKKPRSARQSKDQSRLLQLTKNSLRELEKILERRDITK